MENHLYWQIEDGRKDGANMFIGLFKVNIKSRWPCIGTCSSIFAALDFYISLYLIIFTISNL